MEYMEYDETELIDFFGVMPEEGDPEEREFFGSCAFEVRRGNLILRISFSATHPPKVIAELLNSAGDAPVVRVDMREAAAVRVEHASRRLVVLAAAQGAWGSDPRPEERMVISLDPLSLTIRTE
jgi:hypothetical protein